jgi:arylsulfatase
VNAAVFLRRAGAAGLLLGFLGGGLAAAVELAGARHVREFQAGPASGLAERLDAWVQRAAFEGWVFGALGLALGLAAQVLAAPGARPARPARRAAALVLGTGALWLFAAHGAWLGNEALPFLSATELALLALAGWTAALAALAALTWLLGIAAPGASKEARALAASLASIPALGFARAALEGAPAGPGSAPALLQAGACLALGLVAAALAARRGAPLADGVAQRLARGPLLPSGLSRAALAAWLACAAIALVRAHAIDAPQHVEYAALPQPARPAGPNVVLVLVDTLRADALGCYGYGRPTSPFLDQLAAEGARFADATAAAAWTKPATGTVLTGLYPSRHGALYHGSTLQLPEGKRTLAEAFRDAGYVTAGFVTNPNVKRVFGFDRGFQEYFDSPVEDTVTLAALRESWGGWLLERLTRRQFNWKYENDVRAMNRHVLAWLDANADRRFFLYVHTIDPHEPYDPPAEYARDFEQDHGLPLFNERKRLVARDLYDGEVRYTDDGLGELVAGLRERGAWDETLFVLTSDHGEQFLEHGVLGHGFDLYQEVVRVPLLARGPGVAPALVVEQPVAIVDLAASVLELAGHGDPSGAFGDGRSFASLARGELADGEAPRAEILMENEFGQDDRRLRDYVFSGVRRGAHKLVLCQRDVWNHVQTLELYDLEADPGERRNLLAEGLHAELVAELSARLAEHAQFLHATGFRRALPGALTDDIAAQLQALGYAGD